MPLKYAKAIFGGLIAFFTSLGTALVDNGITPREWCGVAVATLSVVAVVFGVKNANE